MYTILLAISTIFVAFSPTASYGVFRHLFITVDEKKLQSATYKGGRPVEHNIDFSEVEKMKADGMTNKDIYSKFGISKSLFYLKMKEYKNNTGHKKER